MNSLQTGIVAVSIVAMCALAPYAQGQETGAGYTELWRQWRQQEIQSYPSSSLPETNPPSTLLTIAGQARGYTEVWHQWRMRELQSYAPLEIAVANR